MIDDPLTWRILAGVAFLVIGALAAGGWRVVVRFWWQDE